jgi:hypothetical protein
MSAGRVRAAIEQMEAWLADPEWEPDPEALAQWNAEFQAALSEPGKGPGWAELMARAQVTGRLLGARLAGVVAARDQVRAELEAQVRGNRALKGYRSSRP